MRSKTILLIGAAMVLLAALAGAQEKFGVRVYPGAKEVPSAEKAMADLLRTTAGCYRTNDSMAKVAAFYKQQPGLKGEPDGCSDRVQRQGGQGQH
jgi:hypothetical protein